MIKLIDVIILDLINGNYQYNEAEVYDQFCTIRIGLVLVRTEDPRELKPVAFTG